MVTLTTPVFANFMLACVQSLAFVVYAPETLTFSSIDSTVTLTHKLLSVRLSLTENNESSLTAFPLPTRYKKSPVNLF